LKATALTVTPVPMKFEPVICTRTPGGPAVGEKLPIVGVGITVKLVALVAVPAGIVREMVPVVAPTGTLAWTALFESIVTAVEAVPLKDTPVVPLKFVPSIVIVVPAPPLVGENDVMVGA